MNKYYYLIVCCTMVLIELTAQEREKPFYRTYATQKVMRDKVQDSELTKKKISLEKEVSDFKINGKFQNLRIPIVFHILYDQNTQQSSEREVFGQIAILNTDYGSESRIPIFSQAYRLAGFDKKASRVELEFCLGEGKGQNKGLAINWVPVGSKKWAANDNMKIKEFSGIEPWDTDEYLNVWVCNMQGDTAGFAQMPGGNPQTDGIVIDFRFFGIGLYSKPPYKQGKTLSHLVGSYLGLYELWNDYSPCADDNVADTPIHNAPNFGKAGLYRHISLCDGNPVEMNMNIMDNSDDESLFMLTEGQKIRIQSVLSDKGLRGKLSNGNSNCSKKNVVETKIEERNIKADNEITLSLFPNPSDEEVKIKLNSKVPLIGDMDVIIYDNSGRLFSNLKFKDHSTGEYPINIKNMPNGNYIVNVKVGDFKATEMLIVVH